MFYTILDNRIIEMPMEEITPDQPCIAYLDIEQLKEQAGDFNADELITGVDLTDLFRFSTGFDVYDDYSVAVIHVVSMQDTGEHCATIVLVLKKIRFYVIKIEDNNHTMEALKSAILRYKQNATFEKVVFGTLDVLLMDGNRNLECYEQHIMNMEKKLVAGTICNNLNRNIYEMRKQLSALKNYYQRLVDIGERLLENENEVFQEKDLRYIKIFSDRAQRLSTNTQTLCESLIHLREAADAAINYSMNRVMKVFTVVSVIFNPLMLITSWYGMNFITMPEFTWHYGYVAVIILCTIVLIVSLVIFKNKKWL